MSCKMFQEVRWKFWGKYATFDNLSKMLSSQGQLTEIFSLGLFWIILAVVILSITLNLKHQLRKETKI